MLLWCNDTVNAREQLGYGMLTLYQISLRRHENYLVQGFCSHIRSVILVRISVTERTCAAPIVNKKIKKISGANFPHLQPIAELRRNKRGEIGRQHVKAHSRSHVSPCVDHTSPTQTDVGTSQIDHDIGAYVPYSFRTMSWVLLRPLPTEGDRHISYRFLPPLVAV